MTDQPEQEYERRKQLWLSANPEPSPEEYTRAMRRIADKAGL